VHPKAGLSTGDAEEAAVKLALHERAAETIVLASAEKLMAASPFLVTSFTELSLLVVLPKPRTALFAPCEPAASRFSARKGRRGVNDRESLRMLG